MERKYMENLSEEVKRNFVAARYMDDILLLMATYGWDKDGFYQDFKEKCYDEPLCLTEGNEGVFLENEIVANGDYLQFRLKNVNAKKPNTVWRYHNFDSYTTYSQKRSTMIATLKKVHNMAGDKTEEYFSALDKFLSCKSLPIWDIQ